MGACNGDDPEPDSGPDASLDLRLDKPRKEGPAPEQKVDQAEKDLPEKDLPKTDLPLPDQMPLDLPPPDQMPPDQFVPDKMLPDKMMPDTLQKDYLPPIDYAAPIDGPVYTSTWHPRAPRLLDEGWRLAPARKKTKKTKKRNAP